MNNDPYQPQQPPYGQSPPQNDPGTYGQPPYGQPPVYGQPTSGGTGAYEQYGHYGPTTYEQPPYGGLPPMGYVPQPPPKRSLKWLWITLGIVGGLLLLGCIGCGVLGYLGFNFVKQNAGSVVVASEYYAYLQQQKYEQAYSLVDPAATVGGQQVTQSAFTTIAETADTAKGRVSSFTSTNFKESNGYATVTMRVTRNGQSYPVTLQLKQEGSSWKIVGADGI